jgi:4a-hydroxytetrahydrobiopterin dehydratase
MQKLGEEAVKQGLGELKGWDLEGGELVRTWTFADFAKAMHFVNEVAQAAETAGHHPDIDIRYNRVRLALVTHDAGGITANDMAMAREINRLRP